VITDHAMPGMTGTELAARIRRSWPDLPVHGTGSLTRM
jgi:CheY-like chemotaxis protein